MIQTQKRELVFATAGALDTFFATIVRESPDPISQIPVLHRDRVVYEAPLPCDFHVRQSTSGDSSRDVFRSTGRR
jgi:hypothetical protein